MRLLLDESVPARLRRSLPNHAVRTAIPVAVVVLDAMSNELAFLLPLVPALERGLASLQPGTLIRVTAGA